MTDPLPRNTHKPNLKKLREIAKGLRGNEEPVQSEELKSILHNLFTDAIEAYKGVPPTHNRTLSTANPIDIAMEDILQWRTKSLLALLDSILNKSDIAWVERGELRSHETFVHTNVIRDIKSKLGEDK